MGIQRKAADDGILLEHKRQLDRALSERFNGMTFYDLDDQEQDWLQANMETGMTADEAIDDIMEGPA